MKKRVIFLITIFTVLCVAFLGGCKNDSVQTPEDKYYNVVYLFTQGGYVSGETFQNVKEFESSTTVVATPHDGYEFVRWSDGKTSSSRTDENITNNILVTAQFKVKEKTSVTLTLDYRTADSDIIEQSISLKANEVYDTELPVPTKEHFTFNGWYIRGQDKTKCVTDADGKITGSKEILNNDNTVLIPSWTANETFTYKILLVYVTEIHAELPTLIIEENKTKKVDYVMSDTEKQLCQIATKKVKSYLDDMMDGLVNFEVDEYFTTQTITAEDFSHGTEGRKQHSSLSPRDIPEVKDMLSNYDSALTSLSLNDFNGDFNDCGGMAGVRYGTVFFDRTLLYNAMINKVSLQKLINDEDNRVWDGYIDTFIHELAHTIELRVNSYDYHKWISDAGWNQRLETKYVQKLYYTGNAYIEGKRVGLPYSFWSGNNPIVIYESTEGGYVNWDEQEVLYGGETKEAVAIPRKGYKFVRWSDGVTEDKRTEKNVTSNITLTAIFEKIT